MKNFEHITNPYYLTYRSDFELIKIIPCDCNHPDFKGTYWHSQNGYSCVFLSEHAPLFLFDSEYHDGMTDADIKAFTTQNPVVLFFKGSDDHSIGLRFKTKSEALELLECLDVFEDVWSFGDKVLVVN